VKRGASDIHFECFEHDIRVRYRVDGALMEIMKPPLKMKAALVSRFKIMSALNIAERRVPQDGRIKLKVGQEGHRFPGVHVPDDLRRKDRAPNPGQGKLDARSREVRHREAIGKRLDGKPCRIRTAWCWSRARQDPARRRRLYSCIAKCDSIDTNIMTAEDPVEYNMYGVNQCAGCATKVGLTFAAALKAFLRQDPNIIMDRRDP